MNFSVSVIIPVYNGEKFIEKSINSAISQPEVFEVVVVNDGSTDSTQIILDNLIVLNDKIKVYHHYNKLNKGRSSSRNLGIKKSKGNYIAFLDADDYYLKNRFLNDFHLFNNNKSINGVYNAIGAHFYRGTSKLEKEQLNLTTVKEPINSNNLFEILLLGSKGYFSIDGLTVEKEVFIKTGYFSEDLKVAEDTELILKMALKTTLVSGIIDKPLAIRGVHDENSFSNENLYKIFRYKMYYSLLNWMRKEKYSIKKIELVFNALFLLRKLEKNTLFSEIKYWLYILKKYPFIMKSIVFIKSFPLISQRKKILKFLYLK